MLIMLELNSDEMMLKDVTNVWAAVQKENRSHKGYVTDQEWTNWVSYNDSVVEKLNNIFNDYEYDKSLNEFNKKYILTLFETVGRAERKDAQELADRNASESNNASTEKPTDVSINDLLDFNKELSHSHKFIQSLREKISQA